MLQMFNSINIFKQNQRSAGALRNPGFLDASQIHCDYSTLINTLRLMPYACPETHSDIFNFRHKINVVLGHESH